MSKALPAFRAIRKRSRQELDRDDAIEPRVAGAVDLSHSARADGRLDFVRTKARAWSQRHVSTFDLRPLTFAYRKPMKLQRLPEDSPAAVPILRPGFEEGGVMRVKQNRSCRDDARRRGWVWRWSSVAHGQADTCLVATCKGMSAVSTVANPVNSAPCHSERQRPARGGGCRPLRLPHGHRPFSMRPFLLPSAPRSIRPVCPSAPKTV